MQIPPNLELFLTKVLKLSIGSDIAEQIEYQPQRRISLKLTNKILLKFETE